MNKNVLIIRITLWLALAAVVGWFVYMKIAPSGKISYTYDFSRPEYFIGKLTPAERVKPDAVTSQAEIKGGPVYFSLKTPRRFERAKATVKFKNTTDFPVMEIGLLNNKTTGSYDLKPLQNKIIDQLSLAWPVSYGENGVSLIEREKKYDTVERFLSNLPERNEIALYNYNLKNNFLLPDYEPSRQPNLIDYKFRGAYQFYTYLKEEQLDYVFEFIDLDADLDNNSPVVVKVYSPDGLIYSTEASGRQAGLPAPAGGQNRRAVVKIDNLPEAVYRLSVIARAEVITASILSRQNRFVLINKIWLAQANREHLALFTNSRSVNAQTLNPASLGKIKIGEAFLDVKETYQQFSAKILSPLAGEAGRPAKLELLKDDIIISGDGLFSLTENGLFDPRFKKADGQLDINGEKINYVLVNYQTPVNGDGWQTAAAEFDLTKAYQENGKYQFLISVPFFKAEEPAQGEIIIKEIKIGLFGRSWREKLKKYFYAK